MIAQGARSRKAAWGRMVACGPQTTVRMISKHQVESSSLECAPNKQMKRSISHQNIGRRDKQTLPRKRQKMASRHMEKFSPSFINRKMKIKKNKLVPHTVDNDIQKGQENNIIMRMQLK